MESAVTMADATKIGRDGVNDLGTGNGVACLERLQREALVCLNSFPKKVMDLNATMEKYMPDSMKASSSLSSSHGACVTDTARTLRKSQSLSSTIRDYDAVMTPATDDGYSHCRVDLASVTNYYSLPTYDRSRGHHGICKRKYYRLRGLKGSTIRRRPGPLGQLLVFIASKLVVCTRAMVITPSWYIMDRIISMFFQRRQVKNVQCGPGADWNTSASPRVNECKEDNTRLGNFIVVMRPVAVQLIADTTTLKRWLQAVTLIADPPSIELINATATTETIDCWAYEHFFHLKHLQINRSRTIYKDPPVGNLPNIKREDDNVTHISLWNRLVQLRDNYIILYETLHDEPKIHQIMPPK